LKLVLAAGVGALSFYMAWQCLAMLALSLCIEHYILEFDFILQPRINDKLKIAAR
jgi:hypothetical protein